MVVMMGFFAFYCGWIYNDFLGMNLNIFGSCYPIVRDSSGQEVIEPKDNCIYPFGVDPIWGVSSNELIFVNSLKMKISVIIAINGNRLLVYPSNLIPRSPLRVYGLPYHLQMAKVLGSS